MFLVTFHGGSTGKKHIHAFSNDGRKGWLFLSAATPNNYPELRDIQYWPMDHTGQFYLVDSSKSASAVYQIEPNAMAELPPFCNGVGGSPPILPSVFHPFALAFDADGQVIYLSNQDTNVVIRVYGPSTSQLGQPLPVNPALQTQQKPAGQAPFLPGTFVASQMPLMPPQYVSLPPAVPAQQGGLGATFDNQKLCHSVRGLAIINTVLYVADEADSCVRTYNTQTGAYLGLVPDPTGLVNKPTHLLVDNGVLYCSVTPNATNALVVAYRPTDQGFSIALKKSQKHQVDINHPSGMTFDGQGNFYLADRKAQAVYQFDSTFKPTSPKPFIDSMHDDPEFIRWVNDDWLPKG